jgi:hypothetical protein
VWGVSVGCGVCQVEVPVRSEGTWRDNWDSTAGGGAKLRDNTWTGRLGNSSIASIEDRRSGSSTRHGCGEQSGMEER